MHQQDEQLLQGFSKVWNQPGTGYNQWVCKWGRNMHLDKGMPFLNTRKFEKH